MAVRRIVTNIATKDVAGAKRFYHDVLGLDLLMDMGWIDMGWIVGRARRCRTCRSRSTMSTRCLLG